MQLEISWLQKVDWVKILTLVKNDFSALPPEMGVYLKQCTKLDLQWNKLCEIPHCLLELPSINYLNLSHNKIVEIPDVPEWSPTLSVLDLSYNHLCNLPNSAVAPNLKNLNISNNQFRTVPHCVCSFLGLTSLNIAYNPKIVALTSELGRLKCLLYLNLDGLNNLCDPPSNLRVTTADCFRYMNSRLRCARGYYHMKLMVVGEGFGKSTIIAQLQGREIGNEATVGVDISEWKYAPAYNRKTFHFTVWDFSYSEVYRAIDFYFFSKRSLYLLVWDVTQGEIGISGLKPWFNIISMLAPYSYIIVVGTFLDKVSKEDRQSGKIDDLLRKVAELTAQYQHLVVTNITVVGLRGRMENMQKLKDYIYNAASEYRVKNQYVMGAKIPSSYHALGAKLAVIHRKVREGEHEPIMHTAEFKKMVRDLNLVDLQDDEELHTAIQFLHEVGAVLHYDDYKHHLDDLYFVDPRWLCDLMSTVITVKVRNPYVRQGILRSKNIPLLFKDRRFPTKYFQQYLTLLTRFEIVLPLDKDRILIPSMLPEARPAVVNKQLPINKDCYKRLIIFSPSVLGSRFDHCSTPPGLWNRLLSRIINTVKEVRNMLLSKYVPTEEDFFVTSTNDHWKSEASTSNSASEVPSEKPAPVENASIFPTQSQASAKALPQILEQQEQTGVFSTEDGRTFVCWCTGLFYNVSNLFFYH